MYLMLRTFSTLQNDANFMQISPKLVYILVNIPEHATQYLLLNLRDALFYEIYRMHTGIIHFSV